LAAAALAAIATGCGSGSDGGTWMLPNGDVAGTRAARGSQIDASNVGKLRQRWRFRLTAPSAFAGVFASTPVADEKSVYVEDLRSNVFALDRKTGALRWVRRFGARNDGPNGLALGGDTVYGVTDTAAFALDAANGRVLWQRHLTSAKEQFVNVAPVPWTDILLVGTVGFPPGGRGAIYALNADTGAVRWKLDTIERPWRHPLVAGGGGIWYPVSVDDEGRLYAGTANPAPWGGSAAFPNGAAFPGPVRYTSSLLAVDARTGRLIWHDQVTPHDIRDYDFEATPVLARVDGRDIVVGAGKAGRLIAWDRESRERLWSRKVGLHLNDQGPLPVRRVTVCPGLFGGVETPLAYADGRVFVPVVDLCGWGSAVARQEVTSVDPSKGSGRLVALHAATGAVAWELRLPSPIFGCATVANDVVLTSTFAGVAYAFATEDGRPLWQQRLPAGSNACPAVVGDTVLFGAGIRRPDGPPPQIVAYGLP